MPERIYKLQPDRTVQLRGFDGLGAAAALHSATPAAFKVSGAFRDPGDFAVVVLYDADNFYEHPRLKYLPDTNFDGLTLRFDVRFSGLMPLDSPKYATIDWPYLDVIRPDGSTAKIRLFDHAAQVGGTYAPAQAEFLVEATGLQPYDRLTLWYLTYAFDYIVPVTQPLPSAADVAAALAAQINSADWSALGALIPLRAESYGATLRIIAARPGYDGNMIRMYAVAKNGRLRTVAPTAVFQGGSSDATWRVTLDFTALGIPEIRQMWLTFAPPLANGASFSDTEWQAEFTNWTVGGPEEVRALKVAGPGSVRVEEDDSWCSYTGEWGVETGFYSGGYARRTAAAGNAVTVTYSCSEVHDLYVGTSLYGDRGVAGVRLNGDSETDLDCRMDVEPAVVTRRKVRAAVPAGRHSVTLRLKSEGCFYLDFLEAAVAGDVQDALPPLLNASPALDYSTDHTYKLPPARVLWNLDQLGYGGPMNEYIGVFWWNQRTRVNAVLPSVVVTFSGQFAAGDQVFLDIGGQVCGKTVFPNEDTVVLAAHFQHFINATYVGVWATAGGNVLTITVRSPKPAYSFTFQATKESPSGSSGAVTFTGSLQGGQPGQWVIDLSQTPALNRGARDWHRDLYQGCKARGREIVTSASMELVNPPEGFAAKFPDGAAVETSVGFGDLVSTHCAFVSGVTEYQKRVYECLAGLMAEEGLTPELQFGEFCWWYFTNRTAENPNGGMAYFHEEITAAAQAALGRPLYLFSDPDDDPGVNGGADALFLRGRLRDHVAALASHLRALYSSAKLEVLYPFDVNYPSPAGVHGIGGRLNRFVNLPAEWERKDTSGLDRLKVEALDFGAWSRDLGLVYQAIRFPLELGWPRDSLRHLLAVFTPGYAWEKEYLTALGEGIPVVNLWAFDHVCLFGLTPGAEWGTASARRMG
ncbi:MAG TPA: hypothetical protein VLE22_03465 [Bryobacteraceae bacterium]|nr:hypothetical protein [Bryobacteraceae bacterium]